MLDLKPATFEDFEREAQRGNVVPVVRSVLADLQTPVSAFLRIGGDAPYSFLLESIEGGERVARYSFLGVKPWMIVRGRGAQTIVEANDGHQVLDQNAIEFLREHFRRNQLTSGEGLAPLAGGAVGYLAYDAARWFEPVLANENGEPSQTDEAIWMFFRKIIAFDRVQQRMEITSLVFTEEAAGDRNRLRELYEQAVAEAESTAKKLNEGVSVSSSLSISSPTPASPDGQPGWGGAVREGQISRRALPHGRPTDTEPTPARAANPQAQFQSSWPRPDFEAAVRAIKEHIAAGDCYQAVIAQQFTKPTSADPLAIYRALRATNPSPYMYCLRLGDETIVGASPEMLVRCHGRRLDYRPIAGTRRRGASAAEDLLLGEEMRNDEKEVAEHTMLVDLGRNDLGRVSDYGSVKVEELMNIERYSHVQHLVSSLRARLRDGLDRFDALAACFPAGTVTGAPKLRAMEIIRELEPANRGVYAGAVMYVDYAGNLDSCIAIRSIVLRDGIAVVQAGAGIVADSVPDREYEECVNKARAMFRAVELAESGL